MYNIYTYRSSFKKKVFSPIKLVSLFLHGHCKTLQHIIKEITGIPPPATTTINVPVNILSDTRTCTHTHTYAHTI